MWKERNAGRQRMGRKGCEEGREYGDGSEERRKGGGGGGGSPTVPCEGSLSHVGL